MDLINVISTTLNRNGTTAPIIAKNKGVSVESVYLIAYLLRKSGIEIPKKRNGIKAAVDRFVSMMKTK